MVRLVKKMMTLMKDTRNFGVQGMGIDGIVGNVLAEGKKRGEN